ncbi:hypothetical protein [Muricoccus radiodurans]|uniref:hypothetical protein n=1 Tax=Muricoccus radiodurans TaxID=2231721 RepID=UPI003CF0F472
MLRALMSRLEKVEATRRPAPSYCVLLPHDAWDHGEEHLEAVTMAAIEENRRRTGWTGKVLVGPIPCETTEEWDRRYCTR